MGDTILGNRYEIIRKIGDGGMAFVYEAKDRLLNRTVALKVLRPEFVDDDEFLTKFKREAEAVASLSHPNIVNVYDVGEDGKVHYIVMEFVDGKNLKEIIQDEGILDEYTALDITKQIAMALSAAHKKGIIHRDIKPHNILISNEGRVVKVADFGIAKAVSNSTMTNIGSIIGSVHYFSPEQAKGKFVTNNADLYSLGIVLYEMLIGKVPFRGDSPISIALQHINDDIDFTSEEKVRIPQSVRTTIKKLTEKSSADRYQTAEELIEDIEYIEKNIDLDFIKEYDDFATKKIDEKEINKVVNPTLAKPAPEKVVKPVEVADLDDDEDYYDDFYEEDEDEEEEEIMRAKKNQRPKSTPSKRTKKKKKKQESPKSRRRLKVIAAVLILILCAQVFLAYKFLFAGGFGNKSLTVPNLVNMTLEEAQSAVEKEGLYLSVKSEEYNSEVDENCIISQTPEGGSTNVKKGDTINVVVSKGSSQASVPNVVGLTLSNAKQLIEENNLKVGTVKYEYSSIYKEGTVLSQSPGAGSSRAQEGDEVNLYVSKGSEKSNTQTPTVPDKKPTTPENNTPTEPGSNSGNSGGNSGGSNSGNSGGNSGNNGSNSGGSNSGNSGGNSGGSNSGDNGGSSGGSNSGDNGGSSGGSNSGDNGDSSGGSNSGDNGGTSSGTGANIGKTE
ncbi:TPA: PASTA domain-containing Ser/Thr kinase PrkC [Clostridioides difficile]|uniref:PASTA domain-containing Ser/Thr kinase PrkC n=3 Tax=Clostridioides difficile TaxID=1496 RepID=UPI00038CBDF2|nr:PASTA domain-containing Ser/Thr kinase PrkC [Clostridioides difficile]AXU80162.1 serine/threonine-protein kinase and phosphatase [Clostridioides difficile]EGT3758307.1 Stk1 family PASTA domain-containing Ser/Thr kinase [Clostridioides difficile]EGT3766058.1 Stk1 family PASTA domain-containing Ser/Thr kinase [Clostridioides difficile]EGT4111320.1 Stk1 family PASTA domain-containing Ser/Thr kinase [Clostridioides difficile]EGT4516787.1 Stk1 family PASTA domain-containing Ser/Thr kinase [Clost